MSYTIIKGKPSDYIRDGVEEGAFQLHNGDITKNEINNGDFGTTYLKIDAGYVHLPTFASEHEGEETMAEVFYITNDDGLRSIKTKSLKQKFLKYISDNPEKRVPEIIEYFKNKYKLSRGQKESMKCKWIPYSEPMVKKETNIPTATV
tara:strand:- start:2271 stop:2714 length:444 start_codon:yes stop_codon:yes gene_type:complete